MNGELHKLEWVAQCAHRLREHWPHADVGALEEAAMDLWRDDDLRSLAPIDAAARWLSPLVVVQAIVDEVLKLKEDSAKH